MKHLGANNIHAKPTQKVGFVLKPHGFSGLVKIEIEDSDYTPKDFILLLINDKYVPFKIESFNPKANLLKLQGFDSVESLNDLIALPIVVILDKSIESDEINYQDYYLVDQISGNQYPITNIIEMPGHNLIEFRVDFKDALLPFHDDIVVSIDHEIKCIYANFPDGILDL